MPSHGAASGRTFDSPSPTATLAVATTLRRSSSGVSRSSCTGAGSRGSRNRRIWHSRSLATIPPRPPNCVSASNCGSASKIDGVTRLAPRDPPTFGPPRASGRSGLPRSMPGSPRDRRHPSRHAILPQVDRRWLRGSRRAARTGCGGWWVRGHAKSPGGTLLAERVSVPRNASVTSPRASMTSRLGALAETQRRMGLAGHSTELATEARGATKTPMRVPSRSTTVASQRNLTGRLDRFSTVTSCDPTRTATTPGVAAKSSAARDTRMPRLGAGGRPLTATPSLIAQLLARGSRQTKPNRVRPPRSRVGRSPTRSRRRPSDAAVVIACSMAMRIARGTISARRATTSGGQASK